MIVILAAAGGQNTGDVVLGAVTIFVVLPLLLVVAYFAWRRYRRAGHRFRNTMTPTSTAATSSPSAGWALAFYDRDPTTEGFIFAGFWDRFFALMMDTLLALSLGALPGLVLLFVLRASGTAIAILLLGWLFGIFAYQVIAVAYGGGFGMRSVGIRIVRVEDGGRPGFFRATVRLVARTIFGTVPIVGGVLGAADCLWMIRDAHKQTWHDKVARTYVIES